MGKGKDIWATFISSSEKRASGRRESLTGCSHLTATSESAEISPTALLLSFSNLKDLVRTDSELQSGWTSPSGQWYQEERDRQRWWFHNSTQMCPDARTVTQQTSGPHVLRTTNSWLIMTSMLPPSPTEHRALELELCQRYSERTEKSLHIASPPTCLVKTSTGSGGAVRYTDPPLSPSS